MVCKWNGMMNGTTSVPKSIPRLIVDKVRLLLVIEMFLCSDLFPNKRLCLYILIELISLSKLVQQRNVVALKFKELFNIK